MNINLELATERTYAILDKLTECGFDVREPYAANLPDGMYISDGACRVVIIDEKHPDFVIKFGWRDSDEKYCKREAKLYEDAEKKGLEMFFAWTHYICEFQGRAIYAMEYLDCDEEDISDKSSDYCWKLYCENNSVDLDEDDWDIRDEFWDSYNDASDQTYGVVRYLSSMISAKDAFALDQFIWDNDINDLHDANFGYRNKEIVICDYAGYGW